MKDILKLTNDEAKTLLLKRDSYSNISLPEYFSFQELLDKIDKTLKGSDSIGLSISTENIIELKSDFAYLLMELKK